MGLLNDVREWLVGNIKKMGKAIGKKYRTYPRKARKEYLNFSRKKTKTKKTIKKAKKKMLQYVRPIKRGKQGKKTEFGGKGALVHVGGFLFLDYFEHRAFAEEEFLVDHLTGYMDRFGKRPPSVVMDAKYGTNENREMMEELEVRASFKRRGRRPKTIDSEDRWFKKKQRERNQIEGSFGNGKEHYDLDGVRYTIKNGSEIWARAGILAMNLKAAINQA